MTEHTITLRCAETGAVLAIGRPRREHEEIPIADLHRMALRDPRALRQLLAERRR